MSFSRDRVTQWTLGIFLGTFSYCMAAPPVGTLDAAGPFEPVATGLLDSAFERIAVGPLSGPQRLRADEKPAFSSR